MKKFQEYITEETQTAEVKYYPENIYLDIAKKISIVYKATEKSETVDYLGEVWKKYEKHFSEKYSNVDEFKKDMQNDDKIYDLWVYCKSQNPDGAYINR